MESWKEDIVQNKLGGKKEWSDKERMELCHQLDKEMDTHLDSSSGCKTFKGRWTEDNWREKMSEHPFFCPYMQDKKEVVEAPANELSEGLAQLKYDPEHNSPLEVAQNYKEDGVHHFKYKKYKLAIASFTEGIKAKCSDDELNAQLHNNRAAAHFHLENFKSSLEDCLKAIQLKPEYLKAVRRGVDAATNMKAWGIVIGLCNQGLQLQPGDEDFIERKNHAIKEKERQKVELSKKKAAVRKELKLNKILLKEIANRRIEILPSATKVEVDENEPSTLIHNLKPQLAAFANNVVYLNSANELTWVVLFQYPEHNQTDFIQEFNENSRFLDHFKAMFGPNAPLAPWDVEMKYKPHNLLVYYFMLSEKKLILIDSTSTLKNVSNYCTLQVQDGTPTFIILVKNSKFAEEYVQNYSKSNK